MGSPEKSGERPRKGRPPKTPPNIKKRWTPTFGWRFRAEVRRAAITIPPTPWRGSVQEAQRDLVELRDRIEEIESTSELLTVEDGLRLFLERAADSGFRRGVSQPCKPETLRHYREIAATIYRVVGGDPLLHSVDAEFITDYLRDRSVEERTRCKCDEKHLRCRHNPTVPSRARLNKERFVWHLIFKTAIDTGRLQGPNPVDAVNKFGEERTEARHYSPDEVGAIVAAIRKDAEKSPTAEWFGDVVALLFLTGMRLGELAHVQAKHVDTKKCELRVPDGKSGPRTIPIRPPHVAVLDRLLADKPRDGFLLPGESHAQRTQNIKSNLFRRWRAKVPDDLQDGFSAHAFRHSFQTHLLERGVAVHHVKTLMGHSRNRDITDRYAHAPLVQLRNSMATAFDDTDFLLEPTVEGVDQAVSG